MRNHRTRQRRHVGLFRSLLSKANGLQLGARRSDGTTSSSTSLSSPPTRSFTLELRDLDCRRGTLVVSVGANGCRLLKFESTLRSSGRPRIADSDRVVFHKDAATPPLTNGRRLGRASTIYYRVLPGPGADHDSRISWDGDERQRPRSGLLEQVLSEAVEAGKSVRELRGDVAQALGIQDPNRIVLSARGGLREGLIEGNDWEAAHSQSGWLCRRIGVDIAERRRYVIVRGFGREYVYHTRRRQAPHSTSASSSLQAACVQAREIRKWLRSRILGGLGQALGLEGERCHVSSHDIRLRRGEAGAGDMGPGNAPLLHLPATARIAWGATVEFDVPIDVAETYSDQESWLLPLTEECTVCGEDKTAADLPLKVTDGCVHGKPGLCKACLRRWIESSLEDTLWDRLRCPDCPQLLAHADVRRCASRETFARYDGLALRAALSGVRHFHWCLSPRCGSGQVHASSSKCPLLQCHACGARQCTAHQIPWHAGESCVEYDRRSRRRRRDDRKTREAVSSMSKSCPSCKRDVHKYSGCNHITCICGHEWCYVCLARYSHDEHGFLRCKHDRACTESDPFRDIPMPMPLRPPRFDHRDLPLPVPPVVRPPAPQHPRIPPALFLVPPAVPLQPRIFPPPP